MGNDSPSPASAAPAGRTLFGHPIGLGVLFFTQMFERFSYFGMLALLIIYLNQFFRLSQAHASSVFKWYTTGIYFTPLLGGYLADRFLGNKRAVLIGALLMAVGHFLMAFPSLSILYVAMGFLLAGCGLLTPPLTTQVGLLYPPNDPRRDSAYTIFYFGINLGAFISPLACGWLVENTRGRFHSGFTLAGIGMVIALVAYAIGQRWVVEVSQDAPADGAADQPADEVRAAPLSEEAAASTPSVLPFLNVAAPHLLAGIGALLTVTPPVLLFLDIISLDTLVSLELTALCALLFAWVARSVQHAMRDRVLAILLLAGFSVFYWAGAGQYGNAINLWAEQNTDRYLTQTAPPPDLFSEASAATDSGTADAGPQTTWERWLTMFQRVAPPDAGGGSVVNPVPTAWFQAINPLLILLLAPAFVVLWTGLARRGLSPSIPMKMGLGMLCITLAFAVMLLGSRQEAGEATVIMPTTGLSGAVVVNEQGQLCHSVPGSAPAPYDAGRLFLDPATHELRAVGVLPDLARDEVVRDTAPTEFVGSLEELQKQTETLSQGTPGWSAQVTLAQTPAGFDLRYAGYGKETGNAEVRFDPATRVLTATVVLEDKEMKALKVAAGEPNLRSALDQLMIAANRQRVHVGWLLGFFFLATVGELCLSPVGLSMVSQLAPAKFATMLMGVWLLNYAFGNFLAGAFGEQWGTWTPQRYFTIVLAVLAGATVLLFLFAGKIRHMMHGAE